jgi:hypothetical protein
MPRRSAQQVQAEYERYKRFALAFAELLDERRETSGEGLPFNMAPMLRESIERLEALRPSGWRAGMRQAVQDLLEMSRGFSADEIHMTDAALSARGAPALTELRHEIWRTIPKLLARGRIRSETEYYLRIEFLNDVSDDQLDATGRQRLAGMIAEFEERQAKRR